MMKLPQITGCLVVLAAWAMANLPHDSFAYDSLPTESEANQLGLTVQWLAAAEANRIGFGSTSVVIWPHAKLREQIVVVKIGSRIVEEIDANQIVSDASTKGKPVSTNAPIKPASSGFSRLGMEAARARGEAIVKNYSRLGKNAILEEIDQPLIFLVNASNDGGVHALNAETGKQLWSTSVGNSKLPTFGPGVNDDYVTVVNGSHLYVIDLIGGMTLGQRRLIETPLGSPMPIESLIYVPGINGTMAAYDAKNLNFEPITMRFTGALSIPAMPSVDRGFVAWTERNRLHIAQAGHKFSQWTRLDASAPLPGAPQAIADGYIAASQSGMVYRVNLKRENSLVWRENTVMQVTRPVYVGNGLVLVVADNGALTAMEEATGEIVWRAEAFDVERTLTVTKKFVYVQLRGGQLSVIDRQTGRTISTLNRSIAGGLPNMINDRIYLRSKSGSIACLREKDSVVAVANASRKIEATLADSQSSSQAIGATNEPSLDSPMTTTPSPEGDPFASPASGSSIMSDDPFGSPASSSGNALADPFGVGTP